MSSFLIPLLFIVFQLHGTYRLKDRLYTEDTFWGTGKKLTEATREELEADLAERKAENPLAYDGNKLKFDLTNDEVDSLAK